MNRSPYKYQRNCLKKRKRRGRKTKDKDVKM